MSANAVTRRKRASTAKRPDGVIGVYAHAATGGFQIRYIRGGRQRTEQRKTEAAANERAARLQVELAGPHRQAAEAAPQADEKWPGWEKLLRTLTVRCVQDPANEDAQRVLRAAAQAASAAAKHGEEEKLLARIDALEAAQAKLMAARAAGQQDADGTIEAGQAGEAGAVLQ